jgi:hypothetical protein
LCCGDGGQYHMVIERGALIVDFTDPDRQVGDCCPRGYIHVRYRALKGPSPERAPQNMAT